MGNHLRRVLAISRKFLMYGLVVQLFAFTMSFGSDTGFTLKENVAKDRKTYAKGFFQALDVTGSISSSLSGEKLPGVNVLVKGTTIGTVTDEAGNYTINLPAGEVILVFSFIGYAKQEIEVNGR